MISRMLENNEQDLQIAKKCIKNIGHLEFNKENAQTFLDSQAGFFMVVFEDEDSVEPMAFAYGYTMPQPINSTPGVWVYAFEVMKNFEESGAGIFLMAQLRAFFFYGLPCSFMFFLCEEDNRALRMAIKASNGKTLKNLMPYFIANENVDENGSWKGVPKDENPIIKFKS